MNKHPAAPTPHDGPSAPPAGTLAELVVFDELVVGPVAVTPRKATIPYRLRTAAGEASMDLSFGYEEDVFDPNDIESHHLAALMGAQPAINYGLFARRIRFVGMFDPLDRRFIRQMAENTAREIAVNKFFSPNPFLTGSAARTAPEKPPRFLRAAVEFEPDGRWARPRRWKSWDTHRNRYGVLSSGGKDSLLSFGLLREAIDGAKGLAPAEDRTPGAVHPIFINESGRHWFTAVNTYRAFKSRFPNTARVWVNSDRLFNWMLRRMPFIREDFQSLRADSYPIRLWTVAVFLFAALPVMRARGIGRMVVGDEYDTTVRERRSGIAHYGGLFDQSIHFDAALSRYFMQKGWAISQFSVLRPMSELLIEKILFERYPDLLRLQVSCHAAHESDGGMRPCGRCEKCRRIVGMLSALGADPAICGYDPSQVSDCLARLRDGVHQEVPAFRQMLSMLVARGRVTAGADAAPHPEVLALRFDPTRSPVSGIPKDLRGPLLALMLAHAAGAVQRQADRWVPLDPLHEAILEAPYPFEIETPNAGLPQADRGPAAPLWGEMTWEEARQRLRQTTVALLPVGAIEQHGPHLPLDTDAFDAEYLARRVAEACSDPRPLVLPLIAYGISYHHRGFQGTISIDNNTLSALVYDIGISVARQGIEKLLVINGHGGNTPALTTAAQMIHRDSGVLVLVDTGESSDVDIAEVVETAGDVHAGEIETSTALAVRGHLVRRSRMAAAVPSFGSRYLDFSSRRGVPWYAFTRQISESGVMGDPTRASAEKGRRIWEIMTAHLVALVEDLKQLPIGRISPESGEPHEDH